jgi:predicted PurR-regulated permease PerM
LPIVDSRTARVLVTALLFALGLGFLYAARETLTVFLFAIFFAYLISPLVSWLEKPLHSRVLAIAVIYLVLLGLVAFFFASTGPRIAREGAHLVQSIPTVKQISSGQLAERIGQNRGLDLKSVEFLRSYIAHHGNEIAGVAQRLGLWVAEVAGEAWMLVVIPLLSIFFLKDGSAFSTFLLDTIHSRPKRELLQGVLGDLNQMLAHFIRAQLILGALTFAAFSIFFAVARMPYVLVLASIAGLLEFIPVVGPLVAAITIVVVALLMSYPHWVVLIVFLGVWRMVQDYVTSPRIMGRSMELHPLAAIFGIMAGGEIAGILGVFLSIPVMASLRIVVRRWRLYNEKRKFGPLTDFEGHKPIQLKK